MLNVTGFILQTVVDVLRVMESESIINGVSCHSITNTTNQYLKESMEKNKYHSEVWDRRFLDVAKTVSQWSKDPSSKLGAVVVDQQGRIVGTGYNGFPRGVEDTAERLNNREVKYELVVHAEVNAIVTAGHRSEGSTLYVYPGWGSPCMCTNCCKTAIQAGIRRVVGLIRDVDAERLARWSASLAMSQVMCDEAGVETVTYKELDAVH